MRHRPKVIIVLRSLKEWTQGGPDYRVREEETDCAMRVADVEWEQWDFLDVDTDWTAVEQRIVETLIFREEGPVIYPAWEDGGHEQHNAIAYFLDKYEQGSERIRYLTYVRGHGRSESANEVVPTAEERILKDVALACYRSQAEFPPTASWFGEDQREFLA